jgi:hypothetical protein
VIAAVAGGTVAVQVRRTAGKHRLQDEFKIFLGPGARLEDCHAGSRMGHEDLEETVTATATEVGSGCGDIGGQAATGGDLEEFGIHGVILP